MDFDPSRPLTLAFVALTLFVIGAEVLMVRRAAPVDRAPRWTIEAVAVLGVWLALHAGIARSGILIGDRMPPPLMFYLLTNMAIGVGLALSPIGARLSMLPLGMLVGLQSFRLPLEIILHALYEEGNLPIQMTWESLNLDVVTGASAALLGLFALVRPLPKLLVWLWNIGGSVLLSNVVVIAVLSTPTPLRLFNVGPAVVLPFHVPFNWIVNVHVLSALVGHLVIFRALLRRNVPTPHPHEVGDKP